MGKIPAANRRGREHGQRFGQKDAGALLAAEEPEQFDLFGVIRAGRISRCRPYARIDFLDQLVM